MPNSKQIVYLSQAQYAELIANGSITVNGVTVEYNENDIYVTPQAEPVTDVRVNGTSVASNGVANIPVAKNSTLGVIKIGATDGWYGISTDTNGVIYTSKATDAQIKQGTEQYKPIVSLNEHTATFYGLAKASGDTTQSQSSNTVGSYTDEAKQSIQQMLGVSSLLAPSEPTLVASKAYAVGDVFTANGKLYKVTSAIAATETIVVQNEGEEVSGHNAVETSLSDGFVKKTDYATDSRAGIGKVSTLYGVQIGGTDHIIKIYKAESDLIKAGTNIYRPIVPSSIHEATFYGLAKAAGDTTQSQSSNAVGTYTDEAKSAIRTMLGAVGTEDYATSSTGGVVKINTSYGIGLVQNALSIDQATVNMIKNGTDGLHAIAPARQEQATFYGLAKAAGDTTQSQSDNAVGTYTDEAKAAIRTMIGAVGNENYATSSTPGIVAVSSDAGIMINSSTHRLSINQATTAQIKTGTALYYPIVPQTQHEATFYGLAKASGDTTQSASSNAVGVYTDNAKASIKSMLGIVDGSTGTVDITGTTPTITAVENTRYVCGEASTLSFTPPASGISIVRFTSGTTATVLTLPSTVKFPEWFDPTTLETDTIYEICITDGIYGAVMSWAQ